MTENYKELSQIDEKYRPEIILGDKTLCIDTEDYIALYNLTEYGELLMREQEDMKNIDKLTGKIEEWAIIRELDRAQPEKQMLKLQEEVGELAAGLVRGDLDKVIDSIGDVYVVITILSMQLGLDIRDCVEQAYDEIKGRTGKMVNGVFVKSEDL